MNEQPFSDKIFMPFTAKKILSEKFKKPIDDTFSVTELPNLYKNDKLKNR